MRRLGLLALLLLLLLVAPSARAATGDRDPEFNGGQPIVTADDYPNPGQATVRAIVVGATNRTTFARDRYGYNDPRVDLVRLQGDGTPDPGFGGGDGIVTETTAAGGALTYPSLALDGSGRLYAGFRTNGGFGLATTSVLIRYTESGTRDATYGIDGLVTIPASEGLFQRVLIAPDGTATVVLLKSPTTTSREIRTLRFDSAGTQIASYAPAAIPYPGPTPYTQFTELLAERDSQGRVYIGGRYNRESANGDDFGFVLRVGADGAPDATWNGAEGIRAFTAGNAGQNTTLTGLAVGPGDDVAVAGRTGSPPRGFVFYAPAAATPTFTGTSDLATVYRSVTFQPDGKLIAGGSYTGGTGSNVFLQRLFYSGGVLKADSTFGTGGPNSAGVAIDQIKTQTAGPESFALVRSPGGKILIGGDLRTTADNAVSFISRYLGRAAGEGPPDPTKPPGLTGTPKPGADLTCSPGSYGSGGGAPQQPVPVVWERAPRETASAEDAAWKPIAGAVAGATYTVQAADLGSRLRCKETATNVEGTSVNPSRSVRVDSGPPELLRAPALTGIPVRGNTLTCDLGEWTNGPDLAVQWFRDGTPLAGATDKNLPAGRGRLFCEVTASNDVGVAPPARTAAVLGVDGRPFDIDPKPTATLAVVGARPTDLRLTCTPGGFQDDYGQYDFEWQRNGATIAGATKATYDVTVGDLGTDVNCVVFSTNPAGRSDGAASATVLVPLPATGEPGRIYKAGGFNRVDPVSLLAVSKEFLDVTRDLIVKRRQFVALTTAQDCQAGKYANEPYPEAKWADWTANKLQGFYAGERYTCALLLRRPQEIVHVPSGSYWLKVRGACQIEGVSTGPGPAACPRLALRVPPLVPATVAQATVDEQNAIARTRPLQTLWDFDADGRTDATCDPDAPILRSLYSRGIYTARAVIVNADSEATGVYSITDLALAHFPTSAGQKGALRNGQPFACRTSMEPPPSPVQPCVKELTVGRAHMTGNLCPISARRVPEAEFAGLPTNVQKLLEDQALNSAADLRRRTVRIPGDTRVGGLPVPRQAALNDALAPITALAQIDTVSGPQTINKAWEKKLGEVKSFALSEAQHAMDQIYVVQGGSKLNGVSLDPIGDAKTILVPSDAGAAVDGVKKMTLSSTNLATSLSGIPIGDPGKLVSDFRDKLQGQAESQAKEILRGANFDQIANSLKSKLNLGPFGLAGDAKVKLNADGTATIDAYAELPGLLTKPGSKPIRTSVSVNATRAGKLTLKGINLRAPSAYLGGVLLKGLDIDYKDSGLSIKGALLFPPVNQGFGINEFRLGSRGEFQALDVDYRSGAGTGISVGPGLFLTRLRGGLSLNPDEIRGGASISAGPSAGGGCPTAGIDADFKVHFAPSPFFVDATGTVGLVCIPLGNAHFYADSTGLVDISAQVKADLGPLYFDAGFAGKLQLPRWQVDLHGSGGVRHVFSGTVKALIGNLGLAGCGRVEVFPETPVTDSVTIAGGAGVRFSGGRPPFTYAELLANVDLFTGCNLSGWSPFGRDVRQAGASGRSFTVAKPAPAIVPLELIGTGGSPRVTLRAPDGTVIDATKLTEDFAHTETVAGLLDPARSRTVLFVRGQAGKWTVTPEAGSPAIAQFRTADVLPVPKVTARVSGKGSAKVLRYSVRRLEGQVVQFVEQSDRGMRRIRTVKGGGRGKVRFLTSEGGGVKRRIVAQVSQDTLPRDSLVVARFSAPSPRAGRAPRPRIRRRGSKATVTWGRASYTRAYLVTVTRGDGSRFTLRRSAKARSATFGGLAKREGATVAITSLAPSGAPGATATVRLRGDRSYSTFRNEKRHRIKKKRRK